MLLMAAKSWLTHPAALMLLLMNWMECTLCSGFTVDPPADIVISDPGHLGYLDITWSLPTSLTDKTECPKLYQLEYFDTYRDRWNAVRTPQRTYSAQFDLTKDVRVRVYTLLNGPCTNGTLTRSTNYTELVQKPPSTGVADTAVKDFVCVYHNMKYIECTWGRSPKTPAYSQHNLYFWHMELEKTEECPKYLVLSGVRSGCNFTGTYLPDFTDIIFCVNGSSPEGPLEPAFISLQIQDHVKPEPTEKLYLQTGSDRKLELRWDPPAGRVPGPCLEWQMEQDGKIAPIITGQTLPLTHDEKISCFRVRSRLNKYCAEKSLWSEWSRPMCHPEEKEVTPDPGSDMVPVYVYVAVAVIATLVLSLCVGAMLRLRAPKQEKEPDSLLTTLFAQNPLPTAGGGLRR
ncbi:interleukin-13 receptor subunit alpha-2 isoform X2 [Sparus aurata]|uniref:interleukin-13 receptor subunit alpha-2 isoform X2 n=1 Tax=Sparus aurata TaxID=8175 RepID=UPI0011C18B68|nr:interleukin-13 receptor subunit alpha-2-like isoform X2 [Sparus aurata]